MAEAVKTLEPPSPVETSAVSHSADPTPTPQPIASFDDAEIENPKARDGLVADPVVADAVLDYEPGEDSLLDDLEEICAAVSIESMQAYSFAGEVVEVPKTGDAGPLHLIQSLQNVLYHRCYTRPFDPDEDPAEPVGDDSDITAGLAAGASAQESARLFVGELWGRVLGALEPFGPVSTGTAPVGFLDPGWQVVAVQPGGAVVATKNGMSRFFPQGTHVPAFPGGPVTVWWSRISSHDQAGFVYVFPTRVPRAWDASDLVRFYWNLRPAGAGELLAALAPRLDRFEVPYQLKTLSDPGSYDRRCDGTVLYVERRHYAIAVRLVLEVTESLDPNLRGDDTPLFARRLAPGLAMAEDPGGSFGLHRCGVLAEALWNAHYLGQGGTVGGQMEEVRRHFARRGLDLERPHLERPHLGPLSADPYDVPCLEEGP